MARVNTRTLCLMMVSLAGVFLIVFAEFLGLFDGINRFSFDMAFRLRGARPPSERILIVAVDEKALRELGRWPLARSRYAALVDAAREADAVGFTVIMAEPSDYDQILADAVQRHGKVVLPVYVDDSLQVTSPAPLLHRATVGHLHVEEDIDGVVRRLFNSLVLDGRPIPSLAEALRQTASGRPASVVSRDDGQDIPVSIVQSDPMTIDYCGPAGTFRSVSLADVVKGRVSSEMFRGRIVLVGVTAAGNADRLGTPFSERRARMPSVEVHANALNSLLQGDGIGVVGMPIRLGACLVLAVLWYLAFVKLREIRATLVWLSSLAAIAIVVFVVFRSWSLWIDPDIYVFTASFLFLATVVFRLDDAARRLQGQYAAITAFLGPGMGPWESGTIRGGLSEYLSPGGINGKIAVLEGVIRRMVEHSTSLEAANRDLEAFSYSVSHDLQAPLRTIRGFSDALREDCAERLDDTGLDYLARICAGVARMERLIDGLLALSRLSRADLRREPVNLSCMAHEIMDELRATAPERPVEFMVGEGIVAEGDASMLRAVLTNLLENAWKFTAGVQRPVIVFDAEETAGERCYVVRDNGAGFDMAHAERIFAPFQRLHNETDFPGTGIGLSTVQRIIHLHGGDIRAEGVPGKGATFTFTL
ncbi:MAG: CHASE2 domain-containing protein [Desulfuromonadales bacterium]|nr:MAG: CHASE2 domain-containing protein [Desulfuromonadales bacterium]